MIGAYEELQVDLEFANTAYTQALGRAHRRPRRGAAAVALPRAARRADLRRELALPAPRRCSPGLTGLFLLLGWGIVMLVYYNVRDNRCSALPAPSAP